MSVSSLLTLLQDFETAPTFVSNNTRYGGGQGAAQNNDIVRSGSFSGGRRADNSNPGGLGAVLPSTDLSAAGVHIKQWLSITQWSALNGVNIIIASGSGATVGDVHNIPAINFPENFGFIPVWVEVARTPDSGGGSTVKTAIIESGFQVDIGDVGGNAQNIIIDDVHYGTSGLRWSGGTGGDFGDFRTFEGTNNLGVYITINGQDFCYFRLEINDGFTDNDFSIIFPDQPLVATDAMGLSIDLDAATANIDLSGGEIKSSNVVSASRRPDLLVTGNTRTLQVPSVKGARLIQLTSSCTADGETLDGVALTQDGATIQNCTIKNRTGAGVAMITDPDFTKLIGNNFVQTGSGHAISAAEGIGDFQVQSDMEGFGADDTNSAFFNYLGVTPIEVTYTGAKPTVNPTNLVTVLDAQIDLIFDGLVDGKALFVQRTDTDEVLVDVIVSGTSYQTTYAYPGSDFQVRIRHRVSSPSDAIKYKRYVNLDTVRIDGLRHTVNSFEDSLAT